MSLPPWIAAIAMLPLFAVAQERNTQPYPDDPNIKVPPPVYQSVLRDYRPTADEEKTPDKIWRDMNEDMRKLGGHAGHIKEAAGKPKDGMPVPAKEH